MKKSLKKRYINQSAVLLFIYMMFMSYGTAYAAQKESSFSFCGGMFYQAGWFRIKTPADRVSGFSSGLGGKLGFKVSPSFRLGVLGGSNSLRYNREIHAPSSHISIASGGLTVELLQNIHSLRIIPGLMAGGGHLEQLHILSENEGLNTVIYEDHVIFLAAAMLSIEYPLSDKMAAAFMADWLLATSRIAVKQNGPSLRLGLLFTH